MHPYRAMKWISEEEYFALLGNDFGQIMVSNLFVHHVLLR